MRLLIDNALSPQLAAQLREAGYDAVHLRDLASPSVPDAVVFDLAVREERVVVSADTDFGTLLALREAPGPSVVLIRRLEGRRPADQAAVLVANLPVLAEALRSGAVAVIEEDRVRVRALPYSSSP